VSTITLVLTWFCFICQKLTSFVGEAAKMLGYGTLRGLAHRGQKVKGRVVLMHKNVLDINALTSALTPVGLITGGAKAVGDVAGNILDTYAGGLGCSVALRLISATAADGNNFLIFSYF
jgi:hypothetical protein